MNAVEAVCSEFVDRAVAALLRARQLSAYEVAPLMVEIANQVIDFAVGDGTVRTLL